MINPSTPSFEPPPHGAFCLASARQSWSQLGRASLLEGREYAQVGLAEGRESGDESEVEHWRTQLAVIDAELSRRDRSQWASSGPRAPRRFDKDFALRLKRDVPLMLLVARTHELRKSGDHALGLCPFHHERSPSFHVFEDHFRCFGCGAHGDHYDWIAQVWRGETADGSTGMLDFPDAVRMLASFWNVPIPDLPGERIRLDQP